MRRPSAREAPPSHTRAGHYERKLQTKADEVKLKIPKLRQQAFETAIIGSSSVIGGARARSRKP